MFTKLTVSVLTSLLLGTSPAGNAPPLPFQSPILEAHFDAGADGFVYRDDPFRGTGQPNYASGAWIPAGGFQGGSLRVALGGIDDLTILGMSGGWERRFSVTTGTDAVLSFRCELTQTPEYENDEMSQVLVAIDGVLYGQRPFDYAAKVVGDGNGGTSPTSGWKLVEVALGHLAAGGHTIVIGGYNNKKNLRDESSEVLIDDVVIASGSVLDTGPGVRVALAGLDFARFKENVRVLSAFGDRTQGSQSYRNAEAWLQQQLTAVGYSIERHPYTYQGAARDSVFVTKVGSRFQDRMYIVSAHFDGRGGGGAADDDGSGSSLVLECARALAQRDLETEMSIRFVFWNNEETGLQGSTAYAQDRGPLQGLENPTGSGRYPEPTWLGVIQHDMILFDHGLPPQPNQIPGADIDVEYQASSTCVSGSLVLGSALQSGNAAHSITYPAQIGSNMRNTDSWPFRNYTASVSVRENQRVAEIGNGSNPHWHRPTDVFTTYSDQDFRLGFDSVRMTLATVADLAGSFVRPRFSSFGSGCPGSAGTPLLSPALGQVPRIAKSFDLEIAPLPPPAVSVPFGCLGFSNTSWGPFVLPMSLDPYGLTGCTLFVRIDVVVPLTRSAGKASWTIPIPNDPNLVGVRFYVQGLVPDIGVNPADAVVTDAGEAVIGSD